MAAASVIVAKEFGEHAQEQDLVDELLIRIHRRAHDMPGVRQLVDGLVGRLPVAVASNSPRALMDVPLAPAGFKHTVEV